MSLDSDAQEWKNAKEVAENVRKATEEFNEAILLARDNLVAVEIDTTLHQVMGFIPYTLIATTCKKVIK